VRLYIAVGHERERTRLTRVMAGRAGTEDDRGDIARKIDRFRLLGGPGILRRARDDAKRNSGSDGKGECCQ